MAGSAFPQGTRAALGGGSNTSSVGQLRRDALGASRSATIVPRSRRGLAGVQIAARNCSSSPARSNNLGSDLGRRAALSSEGAPAAELGDKEGNGVEEAVDFSKGGWMWTNDAAAQTQARLNAQKLRPKKSLGQNFVTDDDVLMRVARAAGVRPGDRVLEVGPGTGNLTRHLIAAGAHVTAVEKDHRLISKLQEEFGTITGFDLIHGDVLSLNMEETLAKVLDGEEPGTQVKVVANLPYYITTDVLKKLLPLGGQISNLIFMLQEEVAQRFAVHQPGNRDYRFMSVFCRFYSNPSYKFRISRHLYFPKPKVDGGVVDFALLPPAERVPVTSDTKFLGLISGQHDSRSACRAFIFYRKTRKPPRWSALTQPPSPASNPLSCTLSPTSSTGMQVHGAFLHRRKMMKNSLPLAPEAVASALEAAGLNPSARAQDLSLDDFVRLHHLLETSGGFPEAEVGDGLARP